jgi:hypothetical protein
VPTLSIFLRSKKVLELVNVIHDDLLDLARCARGGQKSLFLASKFFEYCGPILGIRVPVFVGKFKGYPPVQIMEVLRANAIGFLGRCDTAEVLF